MVIGTKRKKSLGTHNGIFHCDEVLGIAILMIAFMKYLITVTRTRLPELLSKLDIVIDVGGGKYDHHKEGFSEKRPTGELYASAGLVWRDFGSQAIQNVAEEIGASISEDDVKAIQEEIDRELIIPADQEDNGKQASTHMLSFVSSFLPTWMEDPAYDAAFEKVVDTVRTILYEIIKTKISKITAKYELPKRYERAEDGIVEIPAQTMPWLEDVVAYNEGHDNALKFVIFPYPDGGWAAQAVPPSLEQRFEQLVPFPKEWAGKNEKTLPEVSGIPDAIICHNFRFFARAKSKESIVKMCKIAMMK